MIEEEWVGVTRPSQVLLFSIKLSRTGDVACGVAKCCDDRSVGDQSSEGIRSVGVDTAEKNVGDIGPSVPSVDPIGTDSVGWYAKDSHSEITIIGKQKGHVEKPILDARAVVIPPNFEILLNHGATVLDFYTYRRISGRSDAQSLSGCEPINCLVYIKS